MSETSIESTVLASVSEESREGPLYQSMNLYYILLTVGTEKNSGLGMYKQIPLKEVVEFLYLIMAGEPGTDV